MLPRYKYLLTYRYAEILYDLTVEFCEKFLGGFDYRRTREQMVQAGRSGKQNIVEGIEDGRTSKKVEIKLLGIAKGSVEELLTDYEDFLRQRRMGVWERNDAKVERCKLYAYRISSQSNLSDLGYLKEKSVLPVKAEVAANFLLTLCHIETYLLDKQINQAEKDFVEKGGYTENLFKKRLSSKMEKLAPIAQLD